MTFEELEQEISKYMLLEDDGIVYLMASFIIGNRLPLPPPWVFIVSSSSGGKTKLIQLLEEIPGYFDVDELTGNTLLSGAKNHANPTSLLHKLGPDGFLVFRDFTTILSKNKEVMGQLMGQLRMVYDGKFVKHTGLGDEIAYKPKKAPGLLAGVTTKIYSTNKEWADMGERMIMYHMVQPDDDELGMWILDDEQDEKETENKIKLMFREYIESITIPLERKDLPKMEMEDKIDLVQIAKLAVAARSPVERAGWKDEIVMKHDKEMIGRMLKQLRTLAFAMMLMSPDKTLTPRAKSVLFKMGLHSIPINRMKVLKALAEFVLGGDVAQIAEKINTPFNATEKIVEELDLLEMLDYDLMMMSHGKRKRWKLKPKFAKIVTKFENIIPKTEELPESEINPNDPFSQ